MLDGKTSDCLAIANTAILMRLIEELIARGVVVSPWSLLLDAVDNLENCAKADRTNVEDAIRIIRKELMPQFSSQAR
jgi:hypothetical protein